MALNKEQKATIDKLIEQDLGKLDIMQELASKHGANVKEVNEYVDENKTLQGLLNTATRRAKQIPNATTEKERKDLSKELGDLTRRAVKIAQRKNGQ